MRERQNVLMITVDQLGRSHMDLGGDMVSCMPTVRYLAGQGAEFDNCYSTCPVCIPARRSLMTGTYPRTHGDRVYRDTLPMPSGAATLAQSFRNQGYQAYAVGKLHVYPQRSRIGFDDVLLMEEGRYEFGELDDYQIWLGEQGCPGQEFLHGMGNNTYYTRPWHLPEKLHPTNWTTRTMCSMIKRRDPGKPGFFYASYVFPHPPLVPLAGYLEQYQGALPEPVQGEWLWEAPILEELRREAGQYSQRERDLARRAYYAMCTHIDHQIRLLMGTLRECGMKDNTVILFTSDHGDMLFGHGMVGKRSFYEASANIPLFVAGRAVTELGKRGLVDHRLCSLEDVMPTLLELCGLEVPESVEGASLMRDGGETDREHLYGEVGEGRRAVRMIRDRDFKLIYYPCGNYLQLFDMQKDRQERCNLAGRPEYREAEEMLVQKLIQNFYGGDESWAADGHLRGEEWAPAPERDDFGLNNQRGYHWPPPI